jgi:hypothetical protein
MSLDRGFVAKDWCRQEAVLSGVRKLTHEKFWIE